MKFVDALRSAGARDGARFGMGPMPLFLAPAICVPAWGLVALFRVPYYPRGVLNVLGFVLVTALYFAYLWWTRGVASLVLRGERIEVRNGGRPWSFDASEVVTASLGWMGILVLELRSGQRVSTLCGLRRFVWHAAGAPREPRS